MKEPHLLVPPGERISLADYDPGYTGRYHDKASAEQDLKRNLRRMDARQQLLYAAANRGVLIVLQGMDASGKDGVIRHVMNAFNPQGCRVANFRVPTAEELAHDFLWRIHRQTPGRGEIVIFNRSQYEDVLVVRVEGLAPANVWRKRYAHINHFERLLVDSGVVVLKFFLHISSKEQKARLEARLKDPTKQWKFSPEDVAKRKRWDEYQKAYEDALNECSTRYAPWYIIPSDRKWYRNLAISETIIETLDTLKMRFPKLPADQVAAQIE